MKKLLHTPEGVRDIVNVQCGKKQALEQQILKSFHMYGYHDIQTPMFEYFDVFRKEIGTVPSKDLYKFFDKEGNTLALRPDITPSIARVVDNTLQITGTANVHLSQEDFDFRIFSDPNELRQVIEEKNKVNNKSRMVAGYCWDWKSKKEPAATDVKARHQALGTPAYSA